MRDELVAFSDYVWGRTQRRLAGLTDEEYFWQPAPECWTVRPAEDGSFWADGVIPAPQPPPFTTIAWRIAHLTACYGADRNGHLLHVALAPPVMDRTGARPSTAAAAFDLLERAHARWRVHLTAVPAEAMTDRLGPVAGPFAEGTLAGFVLHMLDEFIHHAAELALLRDLFRAQRVPPPVPDSVLEAATAGRWDLVIALARAGGSLGEPGQRTALHVAAGAGALHAVRVLVELGADVAAADPVFGATPEGWAEYFGQHGVVDYLRTLVNGTAGSGV